MTTVQHILDDKGHAVHTIAPDATVLDALKLMAEADVGSVVVMEGTRVVGIFTERQYARKVFLMGRASPTTQLREVMETEVICTHPSQNANACMAMMTEKRIRHLPVMEGGLLVGLISIGDLLKASIAEQKFHIDQMVEYVGH
ncbi:CBS domain-containing protein [Tropicimonas sp. IMCC6043]|uniref:CBS domain-containing protein n=1 Tax=Tropicimonas sp. IMCC6043 TaxID=2510645 RepID=UPI00101C443A|nr:CBS domain-containing protein [Tropicimonas sp. IMCC6043]RYH06834.1 CBS domain-containing protein [Tropicimonas sp. IMCC6043]